MKIQEIALHPYSTPLINGPMRYGNLIHIIDEQKRSGWGDIAPLPLYSSETLEDALQQLQLKTQDILSIDWTPQSLFEELTKLDLVPSLSFALESALLSILLPLPNHNIPVSGLLMSESSQKILQMAALRIKEGYISAKLKISNHSFDEAATFINQLKNSLRLRIDVNRAWSTHESLKFFSQFAIDDFDYVEEPFQNPKDLHQFTHPLAVDESYPRDLSLAQLETLPTLKTLVYKPTIQGGLLHCLPLYHWTKKKRDRVGIEQQF